MEPDSSPGKQGSGRESSPGGISGDFGTKGIIGAEQGHGSSPEPAAGSPGGTSGDFGDKEIAGAEQGQGSRKGYSAGSPAVVSDSHDETGRLGRMAVTMGLTGAAGAPRPGYSGDSGMIPGPGSGRGPSPQQQGPPAQAGAVPCGPAQTTPLPPASVQSQNESKEENASRNRSKWRSFLFRVTEPSVPVTGTPDPRFPSLFPFGFLLFGGYRRISRKNVLDHDARHTIYEAIIRRPGIDTKTLSDITGINENTLRYHLARLVATGKIASLVRPGVVRYFQNQGAYSGFEHLMLHYLWTDTPREILWLLYVHPGQARQEIADALGISGPSVTRQMEHLIEDRIVENRLPGRSNHYYLTEDAARTIFRLMIPSPVTMYGEAEPEIFSLQAG
jgi:DNA-binding CsgD family transcriptional regulator